VVEVEVANLQLAVVAALLAVPLAEEAVANPELVAEHPSVPAEEVAEPSLVPEAVACLLAYQTEAAEYS
jgi:hypothetical protein